MRNFFVSAFPLRVVIAAFGCTLFFVRPGMSDDNLGGGCSCNPLAQALIAQVRLAEQERYDAMTKFEADKLASDKLEAMLADNLMYTHSTGIAQTKYAFLDDLKTGKLRYRQIVADPPLVRFFGDVAICNGTGHFALTADGREVVTQLVYTAVYVLEGEEGKRTWKLASWHSSAAPIKKPEEKDSASVNSPAVSSPETSTPENAQK